MWHIANKQYWQLLRILTKLRAELLHILTDSAKERKEQVTHVWPAGVSRSDLRAKCTYCFKTTGHCCCTMHRLIPLS